MGEETETYTCGDCGHSEEVEPGDLAGVTVTRRVGTGRRSKEVEILVCPECESDDWLTDAIRGLADVVDEGVADGE